ncbi:MAG: YciI family protein [Ginsengibacter sp.]
MKFLLISRHTGGQEVPGKERAQNFKDLTEWIQLLNASAALPVNGGKSVTSESICDYEGIIKGALIFEAESIDDAVAKAKKSPGLKYGWTHDVLKEMAI